MLNDEQIVALSSLERGLTIRRLQDELRMAQDEIGRLHGEMARFQRMGGAERVRAKRLLEIIDEIEPCHGCLSQRPTLKAEVDRLRKEQQ